MLSLFSVSMPRAGHHVTEMVLRRLFGTRFEYCEFYTPGDCCRRIPCARLAERAATGAVLFVQKSHDHELRDPIDAGLDGTLVQVRDPIARALSNYELDLQSVGPAHSLAYQQWWLGLEAAYTRQFVGKWCATPDPRRLLLPYELLIADSVEYYRRIFDRFALPVADFDPARILAARAVSSAAGAASRTERAPFRERDIRRSRYFALHSLGDFQRLVFPAAAALGYTPDPQLARAGGGHALALACAAREALLGGNPDAALAAVDDYLDLPDAHVFARRMRANLLRARGDTAEAMVELRAVIAGEPAHPRAYIELAELQRHRGAPEQARATVEQAIARARDPARAAAWVLAAIGDPAVAAPAAGLAPPGALTRADVIAAFRFILGREPESESVIEAHQRVGSAARLRAILLRSAEFADGYRAVATPAAAS